MFLKTFPDMVKYTAYSDEDVYTEEIIEEIR